MSLSMTLYPVQPRKTLPDMTEICFDWDVKNQIKQKLSTVGPITILIGDTITACTSDTITVCTGGHRYSLHCGHNYSLHCGHQ